MPQFQNKLVYIQDSLLEQMARTDVYLKEFPFLRGLIETRGRTGCRRCGGGEAARTRQRTYASTKAAIAGLASDRKRKLKEMLNARQVRVVYRTSAGKALE